MIQKVDIFVGIYGTATRIHDKPHDSKVNENENQDFRVTCLGRTAGIVFPRPRDCFPYFCDIRSDVPPDHTSDDFPAKYNAIPSSMLNNVAVKPQATVSFPAPSQTSCALMLNLQPQ